VKHRSHLAQPSAPLNIPPISGPPGASSRAASSPGRCPPRLNPRTLRRKASHLLYLSKSARSPKPGPSHSRCRATHGRSGFGSASTPGATLTGDGGRWRRCIARSRRLPATCHVEGAVAPIPPPGHGPPRTLRECRRC